MRVVVRGLVGAVGVLGLLLAAMFLLRTEPAAAKFGLQALGPLGLASLRADMVALFGAVGILSLMGAVRDRGDLLLAPLILLGLALAGRMISLLMTGLSPDLIPPMAVEVVLVAILALGHRVLARPQA
ncbi:MAG: hypothetical protein B7Y81_11145 [Caulobacter sp. 32-67-35]|nr:MAG: hypothetical protein B7Y81_11145 [Caulobacter sp. 32-67-35]HQR91105.1 hypothetical protein [Caulobacter sp.]